MRVFKLYYNPFEGKTELSYVKNSGEDTLALPCIGNGRESRLPEWVYQFFPELSAKYTIGDSECVVKFRGTPGNFEDLEDALNVFRKENPGSNITVEHENRQAKNLETRLGDLTTLFYKMQTESPYPELRDDERRKKGWALLSPDFNRSVSAEFEISVIATMSSGKSTLINALLSRELLPARNEATTTKIASIKDIDSANSFTVRGLKKTDQRYKEIYPVEPASLDVIERLNSMDSVDLIELEGNIPGIDSRQMKLVLSDTPGPNNSRVTGHRKHIDDLIEADYKPMIMYILNATQLEINDDYDLLSQISKAMDGSGKQGKDRFLFVLNKADDLDWEKDEPAGKKVKDANEYLTKFGIDGARIFPASAMLSKVIRMNQNGFALTNKEQGILNQKLTFIQTKALHFSDYASLSPSCKKAQNIELETAIANGDENAQALVYSGIRSIEIAINEYLDKYALPAKISQAVNVFKKIVDDLHLAEKTQEELVNDEEKRRKTVQQLDKAIAAIEKGDKAKELIEKFDAYVKDKQENLSKKIDGLMESIYIFFAEREKLYKSSEMGIAEAEKLIKNTYAIIEYRSESLKGKIKRLIEKDLFEQAEDYLAQYRSYVESLMKDNGVFELDTAINLMGVSIPNNPNELLGKFIETREWIAKEEDNITGLGIRRSLGKIFGKDEWGYKYVSHSKNVVNVNQLFEAEILPKQSKFLDTLIKSGKEEAQKKCSDLEKQVEDQIRRLEKELKRRATEKKELLSEKGKLEASIKGNEGKKAWLEQLVKKLDDILKI